MSNPAPGFAKYPTHAVEIIPSTATVRVLMGDTIVAESTQALEVRESRHSPVWYVPLIDVRLALLTRTETSTYCPFKGHASYWRVGTDERSVNDAAWGYEDPFDECLPLKGHVAFYADKLDITVDA